MFCVGDPPGVASCCENPRGRSGRAERMTGGALQASRSSGSRCRGRVGGSRLVQRLGIATRGAGDRHPQDPARRRDHAGEPLVRQLLRDVSRAPTASRWRTVCRRCASRTPRPDRASSPYPDHHDVNSGGPHGRVGAMRDIDGGRMDGFVRARRRSKARRARTRRSGVRARANRAVDVMGYHTRADIPNYWTLRATTSCSRTTCSSRTRRGACPRTCSWSRSGRRRCTHHDDPSSCRNAVRRRGSDRATGDPVHPSTSARRSTRGPTSRTCCTAHNVSWGYYVVRRHRARLREPERDQLRRRSRRTPETPGIWNPLPYFDTVRHDGQTRQHPVRPELLRRRRSAGTLPAGLVGRPVGRGERAPAARDRAAGSRVRHQPRQRGDARPRLELDRDLPRVGRLGRLLRPRACRRRVDVNGYGLRVPGARDQPLREARATSTTRR